MVPDILDADQTDHIRDNKVIKALKEGGRVGRQKETYTAIFELFAILVLTISSSEIVSWPNFSFFSI